MTFDLAQLTATEQDPPMTTTKFFFYGTLMSRSGRDSWVAQMGARPLRAVQLEGADMYNVGVFPAVVDGTGTVTGELWEADPEALDAVMAQLDEIEGYRAGDPYSMYLRVERQLTDGTTAWVYFWNHRVSNLRPIPSGDWRAHRATADAEAAREAQNATRDSDWLDSDGECLGCGARAFYGRVDHEACCPVEAGVA